MTTILPRKTLVVDGIPTAFLDVGEGEPLVAMHGIPTSSLLFGSIASRLERYRLIAPDLLGQGLTATPPTGSLGHEAYARHLRAFMDEAAPPRFHLLVHDYGGVLGLGWAAENPERLRSLIVLSTTVTGSVMVGSVFYALNLLLGRTLLRLGLDMTLRRRGGLETGMEEEWIRPWTRRRILRGADHFAPGTLRAVRGGLSRIRVPTLVVWGEEDFIFPPAHGLALAGMIPGARFETIPNCGHWATLDAPDETAAAISGFIGKNNGG